MLKKPVRTQKQLAHENADLHTRLDEAEETLRAIRSGEVDALVVPGIGGDQLYTLKGANRSYRLLIEEMNEGALTVTTEGVILYANRRCAEILKAPLEKVIGSTINAWVAPADQKTLQSLLRKGVDEKGREELAFTASDGTLVPVFLSASNLLINETPTAFFCLVVTDLTEQKRSEAIAASETLSRELLAASSQARLVLLGMVEDLKRSEEALRTSEEKYRTLVDEVNDGFYVSDEAGVFTFANPALARIYGVESPQLLLGRKLSDFLALEKSTVLDEAYGKAMQTASAPKIINGQIMQPDGTRTFIEVKSAMIKEGDKVVGMRGVVRDVTERKQAEKKLLESERRFRALVENISDVIVLVDAEGRILYTTPSAQNILGYNTAELQDRQASELIHPDDLTTVLGILKELLSQPGLMAETAIRVVRKDGGIRWVHVSGINLLTEPSVGAIVSVYHDITKQVQDDQALRESRRFVQATLDALSAHIAILDASGQIIAVNHAWREFAIANHPNPQSVCEGANYLAICEAAHGLQSGEAASMARGLRAIISGARNDFVLESACHAPTEKRWFVARTTKFKEQGPVRIVVAHENITERKQAEEKLRGNEERLRQVWEATSDAMVLSDANGVVLSANPAYCSLYGYTPEQIIGRNFAIIFPEADQEQALEQYKTVFTGENIPAAFEAVVQHADRTEHFVESKIFFLSNAGQRTAMLSTIRDITEHKQVEETRRQYMIELERRVEERTRELTHANRTKDEFLATMSHELRTPLNSVLGLSEILLEQGRDPLSAYQQRSMQTIMASGRHLLELINDVLDLSKIEAGKFDYYPQVVDVGDLCHKSLAYIREQAQRKSITITYKKKTTVSKIYADPRRLKQILINLLANAVKFTPSNGEVTLQVEADTEQDRMQFSIMDTGIGIAAEDLRKLFQPFVQVDSKLTREYEGTGLGLALVQRLTDLHGGSVSVESDVGKGSRFTINLVIGQALIAQLGVIESGGKVVDRAVHKPAVQPVELRTVLLVEDNMSNILTMGDYLEIKGYQMVIAHDGVEALEQAELHQPDIILMDIQMPGMDGLEAIRHLRANPRFAFTPIIALTALAMPGDRERCLVAGADEYMSKPVSLKSLVKTIEDLLPIRLNDD